MSERIHDFRMPSPKIFTVRRLIIWSCALAVSCVTIFSQMRFFQKIPSRPIPLQGQNAETEFSASALQKYLSGRAQTLSDLKITDRGGAHSTRAEYLIRPAILLRSVSILGEKRVAVVAIEGEKQTAVVQTGDEIAGVKILSIEANGINCEWREQKFFVPM